MKKNSEFVGVDEKFIPEDEKFVEDSNVSKKGSKKFLILILALPIIIVIFSIIMIFSMLSSMKSVSDKAFDTVQKQQNSFQQRIDS